ncbi:MAG: serine hydrolase [Saprospiraceae bacterium]|nr:serine hydrolase [Saprospiraceae bacterium]
MNRRHFLNQLAGAGLMIGLGPLLHACKSTSGIGQSLMRVSPESQGVDSQAIINLLNSANSCDYEWHSLMIMRHGQVIAEGWWDPFKPEYVHTLYSLSKSFTSTAVGFAMDEGLLDIDAKVLSFFPELAGQYQDPNLQKMTVKHLLTMNTGHDVDSFSRVLSKPHEPWIHSFLETPVVHAPGTKFLYDTGATFMLSAIVQKQSGQTLEAYLKTRLFEPLGIGQYDWVKSPEGINAGGFGLRVNTEAIARFGHTYLQMGRWQGKQVVPKQWVTEATAWHTPSNPGSTEWSNGYGYQFWQCKMPGVYRGDGAYGQYCIVMPEQDIVIAATSESWDMGKSMQIIFDHLVPGISASRLPEKTGLFKDLQQLQKTLSLAIPKGNASFANSTIMSKTIHLDKNQFDVSSIQILAGNQSLDFVFKTSEGDQKITSGIERWLTNPATIKYPFPVFFRTDHPSKIGATATWVEQDTLQLNIKMLEGIHGDQLTFKFSDRDLELTMINSVGKQDKSERRPVLKGRVVG